MLLMGSGWWATTAPWLGRHHFHVQAPCAHACMPDRRTDRVWPHVRALPPGPGGNKGLFTSTNPELRRVVPDDVAGRVKVKVVYTVLEAQYQSALSSGARRGGGANAVAPHTRLWRGSSVHMGAAVASGGAAPAARVSQLVARSFQVVSGLCCEEIPGWYP